MRYDLLGPRKLRPAFSEPFRVPQPALMISVPCGLSKADVELFKAIRRHVDCLNKALRGREAAEAWEKFEAPKHEGSLPTGLHQLAKLRQNWEGPAHNPSVYERHVDVSSPEHDHARLVAKRAYLQDKIQGHANAGHSPDHPLLQHRQKVLGQVETKLKQYADRGVSSGPKHHDDWLQHYNYNVGGKHSPEHTDVGVTYHVRAQNPNPSPAQKELHQKMATPGPMHAPDESHMDVTGAFSPAPHPHEAPTAVGKIGARPKPSAQPMSGLEPTVAAKSPKGPKGTAVVSTPHMSKGDRKSDKWISDKISLLVREGKPQKQAVAIAYSMAGRARKSVPLFLSA